MPDREHHSTARLAPLIARLNAGDPEAVNDLITATVARLRQLVEERFLGTDRLRSRYEPDDLFQEAAIRLQRSLRVVSPVRSASHYYSIAAMQVHWIIKDWVKWEFGNHGDGKRQRAYPLAPDSAGSPRPLGEVMPDGRLGPAERAERDC